MLEIKNIFIEVENKSILTGVSLEFELGKNYCILGKNGSGKSSLALSVMGHPKYEFKDGDLSLDWKSIKNLKANERAKLGIFLAFQSIPEIKGIKLFEFLRTIYSEKLWKNITFLRFKKVIDPLLLELKIDREFLWRDLNVGFSWGERRKLEVLQIRLLNPKYIFLDEVDSGLDVDAFRSVANLLKSVDKMDNSFIVITHLFTILDYIDVDKVWVMEKGSIVKTWSRSLVEKIKKDWFNLG